MPQATDELRDRWGVDDSKALEHLRPNFIWPFGMITRKDPAYTPTRDDWSAIDFMVQEWDFAYTERAFKRGMS